MILINKTSRIFKLIRFQYSTTRFITLNHNLLFKKELSVPTFCNITADIPFAVELNVLDVHKYHDCDKVFVEVKNCDETKESLMIIQEGSSVYIKDMVSAQENLENKICTITAPIKANLNVNSKYGNITLNNFNGERIVASSDTGNIVVSGFQGKQIDVKTVSGNVTFSGVVQSSLINILVEKGSIFIKKLLGDQARIETRLGNISVDSSYCNRCTFISEEGDINLKNIHKHCEVNNQKLGITKITCLDGQLDLTQVNGKADIHLSRITEHSQINLSGGHLRLRLSEECQENTKFNIKCKDLTINENVNFERIDSNSTLSSSGTEHNKKIVYVNCENCSVDVESGSWYDMNSLEKFNS